MIAEEVPASWLKCDHEYECIGSIDSQREGNKLYPIVAYSCIICEHEIIEFGKPEELKEEEI